MNTPTNLVLVRHGLSEHNLARIRSNLDDHSDWETEFRKKHTSQYRLVDIGIEQAVICGEYIKNKLGIVFDRCFTSEYARAIETAYHMHLPNVEWEIDFNIRERDKGILSGISEKEKQLRKKEYPKKDDFYTEPLGGESMASLCLRVDHFLNFLNRECIGMNILLVTHGTIMEAFKMRLENMTRKDYESEKHRKIKNCQIIWYSAIHPELQKITDQKKIEWVANICPYDPSINTNWKKIVAKKYSNDELKHLFSHIPRYVNISKEERIKMCLKNNGCNPDQFPHEENFMPN